MPTPSILTGYLKHQARQRLDRFVPTSIADLFSDSKPFIQMPETFITLLAEHRPGVEGVVNGWLFDIGRSPGRHPMVEMLAFNTRRFIRNNNQFVVLHPQKQDDLAKLYHRFLRSFHEVVERGNDSALPEDLTEMLTIHRQNLREFVASLDFPGIASGPFTGATCAEYSSPLQLEALHLDPAAITGPLLDIGCGEQGTLVWYLRMLGVESYGLDLFAPAGDDLFFRSDWLSYPMAQERWGTVVSHMAFSHHFLHHHLKGDAAIVQYAKKYMEILESLKGDGRFIYTPGLPFIEDLLPRGKFRVERRPIPQAQGTLIDTQITRLLGTSTFYSTSIQRVQPGA